jgi:hypothetical protein
MIFGRSSSRIVILIIPVMFIAGAPLGVSAIILLHAKTRHLYLAETRHNEMASPIPATALP